MCFWNPMTEEEYKEKYAYQDDSDGKWYYVGQAIKSNYWRGPYGIWIPNSINSVKAEDGGNTLYKNGGCTEMGVINPKMTEEIYKEKYAKQDGIWWFYKN